MIPFDFITTPWKTYVIFAAVRLKIFTILADKTMIVDQIAKECNAIPRHLETLLNACAAMDLLIKEGEKYSNSYTSKIYLVEGKPRYLGDFISILYGETVEWLNLAGMIQGETSRFDPPRFMELDPETFTRGMDNLGMQGEAEAMRNAVDLENCRQMVDVGGGSGLYSRVLCEKYPDLHSTMLDRKLALETAKRYNEKSECRDRIHYKEIDITKDAYGESIDAVLISDVVYDKVFVDEVLTKAYDCLKPGGKLVMRGYYSDPEGLNPLFGALFVLNITTSDPSREIVTITSLQEHIKKAGLVVEQVFPLTEYSWFIEAIKRPG